MIKKILIIVLFFSIVSMGYAADIDVGAFPAKNGVLSNFTMIQVANPANDTGNIDSIRLNMFGNGETTYIASFTETDTNEFSTNGETSVTNVAGDYTYTAPGEFTAMPITAGDYIGILSAFSPGIRTDMQGGEEGMWFRSGDYIPCFEQVFTFNNNYGLCLYGEGTLEAPAGRTRRVFMVN